MHPKDLPREEQQRLYVQAVKAAGPMLEQIKLEEARAQSPEEKAEAIETVQAGGLPPGVADPARAGAMSGPDTVDGIAPADACEAFWRETAAAKRAKSSDSGVVLTAGYDLPAMRYSIVPTKPVILPAS